MMAGKNYLAWAVWRREFGVIFGPSALGRPKREVSGEEGGLGDDLGHPLHAYMCIFLYMKYHSQLQMFSMSFII